MDYRALSQQEWQPLNASFAECEEIRAKARRLVGGLAEMLNGQPVGRISGIAIEPSADDTILGFFKSPIGHARFRLQWMLETDGKLAAVLEVDRAVHGPSGELWQPVWGIHIPRHAEPWVGGSPRLEIQIDYAFDSNEKKNGLYAATMTILHGIIQGPLVEGDR